MKQASVAGAEWFERAETKTVFACLNQDGFETRAVGGAVRNALLYLPASDVDFATSAPPAQTMRLAHAAGLKAVPTGLSHGTVTVIAGGTPFEVTTLRRDVETDGRHATVAFSTDWVEDASRRDFTMNALYADRDGLVHDPLGGIPDLIARRVRFIGDADRRIKEDKLRILRFFRFSASYGAGNFDAEGVSASIRARDGLRRLSAERVRAELLRILTTANAADALEVMHDTGLLQILLGGLARLSRFARVVDIEAGLNLPPNLMLRLAALSTFVAEDAQRVAIKLRLSTAETALLTGISQTTARNGVAPSEPELRASLYRNGTAIATGALILTWADSGAAASSKAWRAAFRNGISLPIPAFPLRGSDLLAAGFTPGPGLGIALKALEDEWIASGFEMPKSDLLARVK